MSITKGVPVPTSYQRLHASKTLFGIHDRLMLVWMFCVALCGFSLIGINNIGLRNPIFYLIIILIYGIFVLIFARNVQTLDKNILHVLLFFRILRKKNITKKYVEPLDDLKKIVPIETVEESGLIRYLDNTSGLLIMYDPPRTPDNLLDYQSTKIKKVINSLYGDYSLQFLSQSILEINNPLTEATTEAMKIRDTPIQITKILNSLHEESTKKKNSINWEFALAVIIPETKTTNEAEKMKTAFMTGFLKALSRADLNARVIENRNEVIMTLRRYLC